jgi:hypothetical protein
MFVRLNSGTLTITPFLQQNFGTGGSPSAPVSTLGTAEILAVTANFVKIVQRFTVPSIAGKTLGTNNNDYLFVGWLCSINTVFNVDYARPSLNIGEKEFTYNKRPLERELALCQRYYEKSYNTDVPPASLASEGRIRARNNVGYNLTCGFKVTKRSSPAIILYSPLDGATGQWFEDGITNGNVAAFTIGVGANNFSVDVGTLGGSGNAINGHFVSDARL